MRTTEGSKDGRKNARKAELRKEDGEKYDGRKNGDEVLNRQKWSRKVRENINREKGTDKSNKREN